MAYKPEKIDNGPISRKAKSRAARFAKRASTRIARRAAKLDPENAPVTRVLKGWVS